MRCHEDSNKLISVQHYFSIIFESELCISTLCILASKKSIKKISHSNSFCYIFYTTLK